MIASSSTDSTVERVLSVPSADRGRGPLPPLRDRLRVDAVALRQSPQALLTMLYRSTDRLRRRGAPVKNLPHSASLQRMKNAPSNPGIKHLPTGDQGQVYLASGKRMSMRLWRDEEPTEDKPLAKRGSRWLAMSSPDEPNWKSRDRRCGWSREIRGWFPQGPSTPTAFWRSLRQSKQRRLPRRSAWA